MKRLEEIDALRGLAIVLMIVFHFAFDLDFLGIGEIHIYAVGWEILRRVTQFLFLGVVGVSVSLSRRGFLGQMKRGAFIFLLGMGVSLATWVALGEGYVKFGVLHFIGFAVPLLVLFKGKRVAAVLAAIGSIGVGAFLQGVSTEITWLFPFGVMAPGFYSVDYFPIFPWLALPLFGLILGELFYAKRKPTSLKVLARVPGLIFFGRHSLLIYLVHQPVIYYGLVLFLG